MTTTTSEAFINLPFLRVSPRARADLGFDDALAAIANLCRTPFGKEGVLDDLFPTDGIDLAQRLRCAMEAKGCVSRKVQPDFGGIREIRHIIEASGKGIVLAAADIVDVAKTIDALGRLKDVIVFQGAEAPTLVILAEQLDDERRFSRRVLRSFDETGALVDDASPELSVRRGRVRALRAEAQEKLVALVRDYDDLDVLRDRNFTIRNDRYVLPVKSEFQGKVDGIVHDASQTHQTVFIEPRALLQLGNRIKIARAEVVEEEQRIFQEMSSEIGELAHRLAIDLRTGGQLEAAFARGAFANGVDGQEVLVNATAPTLSLRKARHPLLAWLRFQAQQNEQQASSVTPNDLRLDGARCLVISGPNAGGKTVALKTAGLISLLARAGIPVPVEVGSVIPAFAGVSVSIGDEQNLQGGFSSFSGHLSAVKGIVDDVKADADRGCALVLLDELMSGTDPAQGAALAQALLEDIVDSLSVVEGQGDRVSVIVTTHYDRLKALALAEAPVEVQTKAQKAAAPSRRFRNASVATDRFGKPTFVLVLDEVGTSNAFDAARRFGVDEKIIERALALLAPEQKELHALLRSLAEGKQALAGRVEAAEAERTRFADETARLERRLVELDAERARLRKEGKRAFLDEITAARATVKEAIAATLTKDSRALNVASQSLKKLDEDTRAELAPTKQELTSSLLAPESIKVGDTIELATMPGVRMTVQEIDDDEIIVARGPMRTRVDRSQLRSPEPEKPEPKLRTLKPKKGAAPSTGPDPKTSDTTLDLRGQRADDAVEMLDAFLDKLLRNSNQTGYVLHGHGGGALKKVVREYLNRSRYVKGHGPGSIDEGGDSWTVVELNADARV